jgi:K+-transporting ATPase ATPase C chain
MKDLFALFRQSLAGLRMLLLLTLLLGLAYPLALTGVAAVAMPWRSHGSLITATGAHTTDPDKAVGSAILGQLVEGDAAAGLFQPRASAAGDGYDPLNTYGSNLGPNSPDLVTAIEDRLAEIADREGVAPGDVPPDAVTASGSGLDPDISPEYAAIQVARVAAANDLSEAEVRGLVEDDTSGRTLGTLGEAHVNVLELNIAVLQLAGA